MKITRQILICFFLLFSYSCVFSQDKFSKLEIIGINNIYLTNHSGNGFVIYNKNNKWKSITPTYYLGDLPLSGINLSKVNRDIRQSFTNGLSVEQKSRLKGQGKILINLYILKNGKIDGISIPLLNSTPLTVNDVEKIEDIILKTPVEISNPSLYKNINYMLVYTIIDCRQL